MNSPRQSLLLPAFTVGFLVTLAQLGGMAVIVMQAQKSFMQLAPALNTMNHVSVTRWCQGRIVFPRQLGAVQPPTFVSLDPQTGATHEYEYEWKNSGRTLKILSSDTTTWLVSESEVMETDGIREVIHRPRRTLLCPTSTLFLRNGYVTILDRDARGRYHVLSLINGEWDDFGEVALPGADREWMMDEQRGQVSLLPRTSKHLSPLPDRPGVVQVISGNTDGEIFQFQYEYASKRLLVRKGLDYVGPRDAEFAKSALAPENDLAEVSCWYALDVSPADFFQISATIPGGFLGVSYHSNDGASRIWHAANDGGRLSFEPFDAPWKDLVIAGDIVASPDGRELYAIVDTQSHRVLYYRREGDRWAKLPYELPGALKRPLGWILSQVGKITVVLLLGNLALVLGAGLLAVPAQYSFGNQTIQLAGIGRRSLARSLDLLIAWLPLAIAVGVIYFRMGNIDEFCEDLLFRPEFRMKLVGNLCPSTLWFGFVLLSCIVTQGLWGRTPGKWICGIRVVQSNFRPCGLARSLLREILLWFDAPPLLQSVVPFLSIVLPGIMFLLISENRQRLGDVVAGTIVVES